MQSLTISGSLPSLNQLLRASSNKIHYAGGTLKRETDELIGWAIKAAHIKPVVGRAWFSVSYYEKDKRRDFDNIGSARKFWLDALQKQGILKGDGWKHIKDPKPFEELFFVDKENPRIVLEIYDGTDKEVDIGTEHK